MAQTEAELFLIDAVKAQRWLEKKWIITALRNGGLRAQPLLLPQTLQLDKQAISRLLSQQILWQPFGIGLRQVAPNALLLRTLPASLRDADGQALIEEMQALNTEEEIIDCVVRHSIIAKTLLLAKMDEIIMRLTAFPLTQLKQEKLMKCFTDGDLGKLLK